MTTPAIAQGTITTVAGTGVAGYNGDGGQATSAQLYGPDGLWVDPAGVLYIADRWNHRVRKVDLTAANPTIFTVAGTGVAGYNGDGGQATSAQLNQPYGVVMGPAGNLCIGDILNARVRELDTDTPPMIFTVAGTGVAGYNGDGGQATSAQLNQPHGVWVDGEGNLYIADFVDHRVRKVDPSGVISTVAGTGVAGYNGDGGAATMAQLNAPSNVVVDAAGNLYITEYQNHAVRRVDPSGVISTVAGTGVAGYNGDGGQATQAQLYFPVGIAMDEEGNLYIGERGNNRVRRVQLAPPATLMVEQVGPNPVETVAGGTAQLAFTVSAGTTVPAGQSVTLVFPPGVVFPPGGTVRFICPADGTNVPLPVVAGANGSVSVKAQQITSSTACFYSCDVQAVPDASPGISEGTVTVGGTTQPVYFSISPITYVVEQAGPNPVDMRPGMTAQMAFTVSASTTVTGQSVTLVFPPGVVFPPGGTVRFVCPADGSNIPQPVNVNADGSVSVPGQTITSSTACFYSCDVQAVPDASPGISEGTVTVDDTTQPIYYNISF
ncbi:NHL repeat-containing protein [Streptomyces sp. NPDC020799]|uniref:NHL repeat-containing protein n=1 Tax=Streptomyces sp. NPDC020799 TaxID=3365091 RepID=UPI0037961F7A